MTNSLPGSYPLTDTRYKKETSDRPTVCGLVIKISFLCRGTERCHVVYLYQ